MITFNQIKQLFALDTQGNSCTEILFCVNGSEKFNHCWMGKMPDEEMGKDLYWFGFTPDGKYASDFSTFEELSSARVFDGKSLFEIWDEITVLEIDGCEPIPRLLSYVGKIETDQNEMNNPFDPIERTRDNLIKHYEAYPKQEITDIFKYVFQSAFGCEHLVSNRSATEEYIRREYESAAPMGACRTDKLDGDYSRVHLSCLNDGLTSETLSKIFCLSAKKEPKGEEALLEKLKIAEELIKSGEISLDLNTFGQKLSQWSAMGFPAVHHSDAFRKEYRPAYRVISNKYVEYLHVFSKIDKLLAQKDSVIIAIEGGSASGKSTLSDMLSEVYDCNVFHMDDFFLRPEQRTRERLAQVGGNIDRERFTEEILKPLTKGETVSYRPFACSVQALGEIISLEPKRIAIVEGVYSMHPAFERYYDLAIFLDIDPNHQKERILKRNSPQLAKRFFDEWIPLENVYFDNAEIRNRADLLHTIQK